MKALELSRAHFAVVVVVVLLVIAVLYLLDSSPQFHRWFVVRFEARGLQQRFGFTASYGPIEVTNWGSLNVFHISAVRPGGPFDLAGFKPGDIPVGYMEGFAVGFYDDLKAAEGGSTVRIFVVSPSDFHKGPDAWRRLMVSPPRNRGKESADLRLNQAHPSVTTLAQSNELRITGRAG